MALLKMSRCLNRPTVGISRLRKQAQNKKKERESFPRKGTRLGMWLKSDEKTALLQQEIGFAYVKKSTHLYR